MIQTSACVSRGTSVGKKFEDLFQFVIFGFFLVYNLTFEWYLLNNYKNEHHIKFSTKSQRTTYLSTTTL